MNGFTDLDRVAVATSPGCKDRAASASASAASALAGASEDLDEARVKRRRLCTGSDDSTRALTTCIAATES